MFAKFIVFLFLSFSFFRIDSAIQDIPIKEANKIKDLFEFLMQYHDFSYVIFGTKPMALADICLLMPEIPSSRQFNYHMKNIKMKEMLKTWYKYKNEFEFKNFILLDKEEDLFTCLVFVIIHKPNMLALLHSHEKIFKEILGDSFNPETFLEKIEKKEISLAKAINDHQGLLGIMLGYGVRNSQLFQERNEIGKEIKKIKFLLKKESDLHNKIQEISSHMEIFSPLEYSFPLMWPVSFCADFSDPETKDLKKKYSCERLQIGEIKKKLNFIDLALKRLIE